MVLTSKRASPGQRAGLGKAGTENRGEKTGVGKRGGCSRARQPEAQATALRGHFRVDFAVQGHSLAPSQNRRGIAPRQKEVGGRWSGFTGLVQFAAVLGARKPTPLGGCQAFFRMRANLEAMGSGRGSGGIEGALFRFLCHSPFLDGQGSLSPGES